MAVVLDARDLNKHFGAVTAAMNVSAAIEQDSVVGLIGTNGAGKTTFINMITGYIKPDAGSIHFQGRDITALSPREVTRIGICRSFQIPQLYASLTVFENMMVSLGVVLRNAGLGGYFSRGRPNVPGYDAPALEVAERILERFGLSDYRDKNAQVLPGGVRKLLDIALTMAAKPSILLLDEPTSGVSAEEKFGMMEMVMAAVKAEGATVLFVEHDMEVVFNAAQSIMVLHQGLTIIQGEPDQVRNSSQVQECYLGGTQPC